MRCPGAAVAPFTAALEPELSPVAEPGRAPERALATTLAVTSPPKSERESTCAVAVDAAAAPEEAVALAVTEPLATRPLQQEKSPMNWATSPGAAIAGVPAPAWPGIETLMPYARAAEVDGRSFGDAP